MNAQDVKELAIARVARIFKSPIASIRGDMRFGEDLIASFVSDFRRNELDVINDDLRDVADKATSKALASGRLEIRTVEDYCMHLVHCHQTNSSEVERLLRSERAQ